jgi:hypothetical protein
VNNNYICEWRGLTYVIDSATSENHARRVFAKAVEKYNRRIIHDHNEISAKYVVVVTDTRGFVEYK